MKSIKRIMPAGLAILGAASANAQTSLGNLTTAATAEVGQFSGVALTIAAVGLGVTAVFAAWSIVKRGIGKSK